MGINKKPATDTGLYLVNTRCNFHRVRRCDMSQNVVRTLGGSIRARNGELGAIVEVSLPLSVLMLEDEEDDDAE